MACQVITTIGTIYEDIGIDEIGSVILETGYIDKEKYYYRSWIA